MTHGFNLESAAPGAVMLAAINAGLGARPDNPVAAAVVPASLARLFGLALMIAGGFLARKPPV